MDDKRPNPATALSAAPPASRRLALFAWATVILVSAAPDIAVFMASGNVPPAMVFGKMGLLLALGVLAAVRRPLRPLLGYFSVLLALFAFNELRTRIDFNLPPLRSLFGANVLDARMQAEQTGKLTVSLAMAMVLLLLGYKRRDFFLSAGNVRARIEPVPWLGFPKPDSWISFGLQWGCYIAAALALIQYLGLRPTGVELARILPCLPSILLYAALNAFNEEMTYRAPLLATLEPAAGSRNALWISAFFFGIAHYFGTPGGLFGGIASIFMGWILGKAMLETRGLFWPWLIHFLSDVVIFAFLTAALLK